MKDQPATDSYDIIRRPIITEKATLASENNTVAFEVSIKSTKKQIKGAIENLFNVKVESVNTLIVKGKVKIEIAVAKGKKLYDKRQVKKKRDWNRERARLLSRNNK